MSLKRSQVSKICLNKRRRRFKSFPTKLGSHKFIIYYLNFTENKEIKKSIFINNTDVQKYLNADCGAGINYEEVARKLLLEFVKSDKKIFGNFFRFTPATIERCSEFVKTYYKNK